MGQGSCKIAQKKTQPPENPPSVPSVRGRKGEGGLKQNNLNTC
ncbi:MAG: hypothetical protein JETT_3695 [Candidatus Jettenia ecosi]|uniref:Uncharacterized protein n=1 Tax=Candidatus Jettenia ecosi TaxID=2494326 RepID=A0A533QBQ3_9BACT|nr:MAG: hypothetical protein JETT_3695 [Candidatus Jettenia ecosi]